MLGSEKFRTRHNQRISIFAAQTHHLGLSLSAIDPKRNPKRCPWAYRPCIDLIRGCKVGIIRRYSYVFAFILPVVCCAFIYFGTGAALAQDPVVSIEPRAGTRPDAQGSANRINSRISVDSDLVLIPVMVTDHHDRLITGLEKTHFRLYDDKVEQVITHFASEDAPVSIALVFDCSGSMGPKMQKSRAAVSGVPAHCESGG